MARRGEVQARGRDRLRGLVGGPALPSRIRGKSRASVGRLTDVAIGRYVRAGYPLPEGVDRLYHFHVRKTGGSSVNDAFRRIRPPTGLPAPRLAAAAWRAARRPVRREVRADGWVIASHDRATLERGVWSYGHSHRPAHGLRLPEGTFRFTVLRDPLRRLVRGHVKVLAGGQEKSSR